MSGSIAKLLLRISLALVFLASLTVPLRVRSSKVSR